MKYKRGSKKIRLVGSFIEIKARKSELHVRQSWQNNKWVVIGNRNKKQRYTHDSVSDTSSIGSCSVDDKFQNIKEGDIESDDGESVCEGWYFGDNKKELGLGAEIHRLELKAYRRTIEALHASGPLSWEKESMVTNLRMSLHISNNEHLIHLKNLISSSSSIPNR
ncbi:unnamed protein product [Lactuca virosa]|uniref:ENT domain-containing protein n=1 Tax=Lactuca virosa TaxID=75947 RepID=A0AAU9MI13_9ASTR|nr:unnamed protein product [Lactuca virosa]